MLSFPAWKATGLGAEPVKNKSETADIRLSLAGCFFESSTKNYYYVNVNHPIGFLHDPATVKRVKPGGPDNP
jgi:hypothetical protein